MLSVALIVIAAPAVLVFPLEIVRLLYAMAFIFCAPVPLKFTVLGVDEVTFKIPAVMVKVFATPKTAAADNCRDVPLIAVLKRFAVPLNTDVPVNVAVPALPLNVPLTTSDDATEKLAVLITAPLMAKPAKFNDPAPLIVLVIPLIVTVPAVLVKVPVFERFPVRTKDEAALTVPVIVRLSIEIPEPFMVVAVPVMFNVPPLACENDPVLFVSKLPVKLTDAFENVTNGAETVKLLKFWPPLPLTDVPAPVKIIVPLLPLKIPLFFQLPPALMLKLPPLNVVPAPIIVLSPTVILAAALMVTAVPVPIVVVNFPKIVVAVAGMVFTAAPALLLSFRLPYGLFATVCVTPLYSTVLATTRVLVAKFVGYVLFPPIFKVALLFTVSIPPDVNLFAVKVPKSNMPAEINRSPAILILEFKLTEPAVFVTLISLKLVTKVPPII